MKGILKIKLSLLFITLSGFHDSLRASVSFEKISYEGYYRYPTIFDNKIVFSSEGDLWSVPTTGGFARRLTSGLGFSFAPKFSPDGKWICFNGTEEGKSAIYKMPADGGRAVRLTYLSASSRVVGWTDRGIIYNSELGNPSRFWLNLWSVSPEGGEPEKLPTGHLSYLSFGPDGKSVGRAWGNNEPTRWKEYKGGTTGRIWIDRRGDGEYEELLKDMEGNPSRTLWIGDRIFFDRDFEGRRNIWSCALDGTDLKQHTFHEDYVRHISTDGERIVYDMGGDLFVFDPSTDSLPVKVNVEYVSPFTQMNRKFVSARQYLDGFDLHPGGERLALITRGHLFTAKNWSGAVTGLCNPDEIRVKSVKWLDENRLLTVSDYGDREIIEIYDMRTRKGEPVHPDLDFGKIRTVKISPDGQKIVFNNHRNELLFIDLETWIVRHLDTSKYGEISGFDWSPDGKWIAYGFDTGARNSLIKIINPLEDEAMPHLITTGEFKDFNPIFDPQGKYLFFISNRGLLHGERPYFVTLQEKLTSIMNQENDENDAEDHKEAKESDGDAVQADPSNQDERQEEDALEGGNVSAVPQSPFIMLLMKMMGEKSDIKIDFEGIQDRVFGFRIFPYYYHSIRRLGTQLLFEMRSDDHDRFLLSFDPTKGKVKLLHSGFEEYQISENGKAFAFRVGNHIRVTPAGKVVKFNKDALHFSKGDGWIDMDRFKVLVNPKTEWKHIFLEAWRYQKEHYWNPSMSQIDWTEIRKKYEPRLSRIGTREELEDLLWEMVGELRTSHAYVFGGDQRVPPNYSVGSLAATFKWDPSVGAYRIYNIGKGDAWDPNNSAPLYQPGVQIKEGDLLWAINGEPLDADTWPEKKLFNLGEEEVKLLISDGAGTHRRHTTVQTLHSEFKIRYRDWVEKNKAYVAEKTGGRVGYLHVPDMGYRGWAEFNRAYFNAIQGKLGVVVDVRWNEGGNISQYLFQKLAIPRLGTCVSRWNATENYPMEAPPHAMVALTNEHAGSDGDIFSHNWKELGLGPLVGKRTWGGVIGINYKDPFTDGGLSTAPEYAFFFRNQGLNIENRGVEPTIEVTLRPQDVARGVDPQLDRAIEEVLKIIQTHPEPNFVDMGSLPRLTYSHEEKIEVEEESRSFHFANFENVPSELPTLTVSPVVSDDEVPYGSDSAIADWEDEDTSDGSDADDEYDSGDDNDEGVERGRSRSRLDAFGADRGEYAPPFKRRR